MTQTSKEKTEREAAFERMKAIYDDDQLMSPGSRAELRRAPTPEALLLQPAFYRLTGGAYWDGWQRMAFILPHVKKVSTDEKPVGRSFAEADSGKAFDVDNKKDKLTPVGVRLTQIKRLDPPQDLIQLRRPIVHLEPAFNWLSLAKILYWWGDESKKQLLEDYFRAKYAGERTAKKGN
jgi:CRISPR system Cascade subunit CasB